MPYVGNTYYDDDIYKKYFVKRSKSSKQSQQFIKIDQKLTNQSTERQLNILKNPQSSFEQLSIRIENQTRSSIESFNNVEPSLIFQQKEQISNLVQQPSLIANFQQPSFAQQENDVSISIPSLSLFSLKNKLPPPRLYTSRRTDNTNIFESQMEQIIDVTQDYQKTCLKLFGRELSVQLLQSLKNTIDQQKLEIEQLKQKQSDLEQGK